MVKQDINVFGYDNEMLNQLNHLILPHRNIVHIALYVFYVSIVVNNFR